jgi:hypothetical protein
MLAARRLDSEAALQASRAVWCGIDLSLPGLDARCIGAYAPLHLVHSHRTRRSSTALSCGHPVRYTGVQLHLSGLGTDAHITGD